MFDLFSFDLLWRPPQRWYYSFLCHSIIRYVYMSTIYTGQWMCSRSSQISWWTQFTKCEWERANTLFFWFVYCSQHICSIYPMNNILDDLKFCEVAIKSVANIFKNRKLFITLAITFFLSLSLAHSCVFVSK